MNIQVYIPALVGRVPDEIVQVFVTFADIVYIIRRSDFDQDVIALLRERIDEFFQQVKIFIDYGVRKDMNLPRQHYVDHYDEVIEDFGSPGGSDSSITEHRHIEDVKRHWRKTNHNNATGQIVKMVERKTKLNKLRILLETVGKICHLHKPAPKPGFSHGKDTDEGEFDDLPLEAEKGYGKATLAKKPRKFFALLAFSH
jgi:hypothetical protein